MLKAFIDDSGSGGESPWFVLAGYVGTADGWNAFDPLWLEMLHQHPRIEYFKAVEAERLHPRGQWAGVSVEQRNAKMDGLIRVIARCARRAVSARIRQSDYDQFVKGNVPPMWDSPYYMLQTFVIGAAVGIEQISGDCESVEFVFDEEQRHEKRLVDMLPGLKAMDALRGSLANVSFRNDRNCLPLQAADLVAWQIRRFFSTNERRRKHFDSSQKSLPEAAENFVVTRAMVKSIVAEMHEKALELLALGRIPNVRPWE